MDGAPALPRPIAQTQTTPPDLSRRRGEAEAAQQPNGHGGECRCDRPCAARLGLRVGAGGMGCTLGTVRVRVSSLDASLGSRPGKRIRRFVSCARGSAARNERLTPSHSPFYAPACAAARPLSLHRGCAGIRTGKGAVQSFRSDRRMGTKPERHQDVLDGVGLVCSRKPTRSSRIAK